MSEQNVLTVGTPNGHLTALSGLHPIIIVVHIVTKWYAPIQAKPVCTQRRGTNERLPNQTIWDNELHLGKCY
jgi:hypothetical protein